MLKSNQIAVFTNDEINLIKAKNLSKQLNIPLVNDKKMANLLVVVTKDKLELEDWQNRQTFCVDFEKSQIKYRLSHNNKEILLRSCKVKDKKTPTILDATAGWGKDSFMLLNAGYKVTMLEKNKLVFALLKDGLERIQNKELKFKCYNVDSLEYLKCIDEEDRPDVIYIDPMRSVRTPAKSKKDMMLLREIVENDENNIKELINIAIDKAKNKVVVKYHLYETELYGLKPDVIFKGKNTAFFVYRNTETKKNPT